MTCRKHACFIERGADAAWKDTDKAPRLKALLSLSLHLQVLGGKMDSELQKEYHSHVRGAATFILLGQQDPPMDAAELMRLYKLDLKTVTADIDAIVQSERHKVDGVFEVKK
jgi:hypothetical protein